MKLIHAIIKSMDWSIKSKKSQLLRQKCNTNKVKSSTTNLKSLHGEKYESRAQLTKTDISNNDLKVSDYFSLDTENSRLLGDSKETLNLELLLRKLHVLRQILRKILNDLNNLLVFHDKTYCNICVKCREFAYNDDNNRLETFDIIDTLMQSLGVDAMLKKRGSQQKNINGPFTKPSNKLVILKENEVCLDESTDSSDEPSSNESEFNSNVIATTSDTFHKGYRLPFRNNRVTKNTHNFRCELILFLSMLRDIICSLYDISASSSQKIQDFVNFQKTEKQIQKMKQEYLSILGYVTELIEGPKCEARRRKVKRNYKRIIVKLKLNILISKKHIFEILYEMCKLKKSMKKYQIDFYECRNNKTDDALPSVSSQVLVKIQDICSKLKESNNALDNIKETQMNLNSPPNDYQINNYNSITEKMSEPDEISPKQNFKKYEYNKAGVQISITKPELEYRPGATIHRSAIESTTNKPEQSLKVSYLKSETNLQDNKRIIDKEHKLLQMIYKLLDNYLQKTKEVDLEKIKQFMEKEALNYSLELEKICSLNNQTETPQKSDRKTEKNIVSKLTPEQKPKKIAAKSGEKKELSSIEYLYKCHQILSTTDDEKKHVIKPDYKANNYTIEKKNVQEFSFLRGIDNSKTQKKPLQIERRDSNESTFDKKYKDKILDYVNENVNGVKKNSSDQIQVTNRIDDNFYNIYDRKKISSGREKFRNYYTDDEYGKFWSKTDNKELLQELKRLEIIVYCLQNKSSSGGEQQENNKQREPIKSSGTVSKEENKKEEKVGEIQLKRNNLELRSNQETDSTVEPLPNKILENNSEDRNLPQKDTALDYRNLKEVSDSIKKYEHINRDSILTNYNLSVLSNTSPTHNTLLFSDCKSTVNQDTETINQKTELPADKKTEQKSINADDIKVEKPSDIIPANQNRYLKILETDLNLNESSVLKNQTESKKEINNISLKPNEGHADSSNLSNDFPKENDTSQEKETNLHRKSVEITESTDNKKIEKKDQMVQISSSQNLKTLNLLKTIPSRKDKLNKYRKKKSVTKLNPSIKSANKSESKILDSPNPSISKNNSSSKFSDSRDSSSRKTVSENISAIQNQLKSSLNWQKASSNTLPIMHSSHNPITSNSLVSTSPNSYFQRILEKNKTIQHSKEKGSRMNQNMDYTSNKIMQNCMSLIINEKNSTKNFSCVNTFQENEGKIISKTQDLLNATKEYYNKKNSLAMIDEHDYQKAANIRIKVANSSGLANDNHSDLVKFNKVEKLGESSSNNDTSISKGSKTQSNEIKTLFTFENLINSKNKPNSCQKLDGCSENLFSFPSNSDTTVFNCNLLGQYYKSQNEQDFKQRENSENNISSGISIKLQKISDHTEKSMTATKCDYVKAKLDLMNRKNFQTNSIYDCHVFAPPFIQNTSSVSQTISKTQPKPLSNSNEPLTIVYMDCLLNKNVKSEGIIHTISNSLSCSTPKLKTTSLIEIDKEDISHQMIKLDLDEQISENDSKGKLTKKPQTTLKTKVKSSERNKRIKKSLHRKKSKISQLELSSQKEIMHLTPTTIKIDTELLLPKAHLTKCMMKNKMFAKEQQQEIVSQTAECTDYWQKLAILTDMETKESNSTSSTNSKSNKNFPSKFSPKKLEWNKDLVLLNSRSPIHIYDYKGLPLTNSKGESLIDAFGQPLIKFDKNGRPISDLNDNPIFDASNTPNTDYTFNPFKQATDNPFKIQLTNEQGKPLVLYNEAGYPVTDDKGYSLYDISGNPLIQFDSCGRPVSDNKGNPLRTPRNDKDKYSRKKFQKSSDQTESHTLASTCTDSIASNGASFVSQGYVSDIHVDTTTQNSLANSSLKSSEDFSDTFMKENSKGYRYSPHDIYPAKVSEQITKKDLSSSSSTTNSDDETKIMRNTAFNILNKQDITSEYKLKYPKLSLYNIENNNKEISTYLQREKNRTKLLDNSKDKIYDFSKPEVPEKFSFNKIVTADEFLNGQKCLEHSKKLSLTNELRENMRENEVENKILTRMPILTTDLESEIIPSVSDTILQPRDHTNIQRTDLERKFKIQNHKNLSNFDINAKDFNEKFNSKLNDDTESKPNKRKKRLNSAFTLTDSCNTVLHSLTEKAKYVEQEYNSQRHSILNQDPINHTLNSDYKMENCGDIFLPQLEEDSNILPPTFIRKDEMKIIRKKLAKKILQELNPTLSQDLLYLKKNKPDLLQHKHSHTCRKYSKLQKSKSKTSSLLHHKPINLSEKKPLGGQFFCSNITKKLNDFSYLLDLKHLRFLRRNKSHLTKRSDKNLLDFSTLKKFLNDQFITRNISETSPTVCRSKHKECKHSRRHKHREKSKTDNVISNLHDKQEDDTNIVAETIKKSNNLLTNREFVTNFMEHSAPNKSQTLQKSNLRCLQVRKTESTTSHRSCPHICKQTLFSNSEYDDTESSNPFTLSLMSRPLEKDLKKQMYINKMKNDIIYENPIEEELESYLIEGNRNIKKSEEKLVKKKSEPKEYDDSETFINTKDDCHSTDALSHHESIEIMNEIFNSIVIDKYNTNEEKDALSMSSLSSEHKSLTQISETCDQSLTGYSENILEVFNGNTIHNQSYDFFNRPLYDRWRRPLFDEYGRPLYDLFTRPLYNKQGQPYTDAYDNVITTFNRDDISNCEPLCGDQFEYISPVILEKILNNEKCSPIKDPFGGPLFAEDGMSLYNKFGKPLFNLHGQFIYDANGLPEPVQQTYHFNRREE